MVNMELNFTVQGETKDELQEQAVANCEKFFGVDSYTILYIRVAAVAGSNSKWNATVTSIGTALTS